MKLNLFTYISALIIMVGCSSDLSPAEVLPATAPFLTATLPPTRTAIPFPTSTPVPTLTPSITPIASITPQPGFDVWDGGSVVGYYTVQFPRDKWLEGGSVLNHKTLEGCSIALHGGSGICMGGGCKETGIILGDAGFSKTMVGDSFSIYVSHAVRSWISYEIRAKEPPEQCMRDGEEVLATITLRPERGCSDRAEFVANITIPDNAAIPAGTTSSCSGPNSTSYILNPDNIKIRSEP